METGSGRYSVRAFRPLRGLPRQPSPVAPPPPLRRGPPLRRACGSRGLGRGPGTWGRRSRRRRRGGERVSEARQRWAPLPQASERVAGRCSPGDLPGSKPPGGDGARGWASAERDGRSRRGRASSRRSRAVSAKAFKKGACGRVDCGPAGAGPAFPGRRQQREAG